MLSLDGEEVETGTPAEGGEETEETEKTEEKEETPSGEPESRLQDGEEEVEKGGNDEKA